VRFRATGKPMFPSPTYASRELIVDAMNGWRLLMAMSLIMSNDELRMSWNVV